MNNSLGQHLRTLRNRKGLTLAQLAEKSGVSQATLSRIENDDVSPTAETLGGLGTALNTPISQLLAPLEKRFTPHIECENQVVWTDSDRAFKRRNVSPPSDQLAIEMIEVELGPNQILNYAAPSVAGQEHHLYILSGTLSLKVGGAGYKLRMGDCLRYKLFGETEFRTGENPVRYILALT